MEWTIKAAEQGHNREEGELEKVLFDRSKRSSSLLAAACWSVVRRGEVLQLRSRQSFIQNMKNENRFCT
jgi:hypothetical protein